MPNPSAPTPRERPLDLDRLEELAKKPAPWSPYDSARYYAATSPETILALIERLRRAEKLATACTHPRGHQWEDSAGHHSQCDVCGQKWSWS